MKRKSRRNKSKKKKKRKLRKNKSRKAEGWPPGLLKCFRRGRKVHCGNQQMPRITREEERLAGVIDRLRRDEAAARDNAWSQHHRWRDAENRFINAPRAEVVTATELREIALNFARGRRVGRGKNCTRKRRKKRRKRKKSGRGPALDAIKKALEEEEYRKMNNFWQHYVPRHASTWAPSSFSRDPRRKQMTSTTVEYGDESKYKYPVGRSNIYPIRKKKGSE